MPDDFALLRHQFGGLRLMLREDVEDYACSILDLPPMQSDDIHGCAALLLVTAGTDKSRFLSAANDLDELSRSFESNGFKVPLARAICSQVDEGFDDLLWAAWHEYEDDMLTSVGQTLLMEFCEQNSGLRIFTGTGRHFSAAYCALLVAAEGCEMRIDSAFKVSSRFPS